MLSDDHRVEPQARGGVIRERPRLEFEAVDEQPPLPRHQRPAEDLLAELDRLETERGLGGQLTQRASPQPWFLSPEQPLGRRAWP